MRCATRDPQAGTPGPLKRTVWYAEEAYGVGTRFAGRTVRPSDFADAVENLCIIRAKLLPLWNPYTQEVSQRPKHSRYGHLAVNERSRL